MASPSRLAPALGDLSKWQNVEFLRYRVVYGSRVKVSVKPFDTPTRLNWSALLGISGAAVVSATLWIAVGFTFGLLWR